MAHLQLYMYRGACLIEYCCISKAEGGVVHPPFKQHCRVATTAVSLIWVVQNIHQLHFPSATAYCLIANLTISQTGPKFSSATAMEQDIRAVAKNQSNIKIALSTSEAPTSLSKDSIIYKLITNCTLVRVR